MENKFVSSSVAKLYLQPDFADIYFELWTDDQVVRVAAHKNILAISSPVFQAMLFGQLKENEVIRIADIDGNAFLEFLQFFYLPRVKLTIENIEAVARLADKYAMPDSLDIIVEFLENNLDETSMFWGYQLAIALNIQKLKTFCESHIQMFTVDSFYSDEFLHCDREVLRHILQLEKMLCCEADLFARCVEWAKSSCKDNSLNEDDSANVRNQLGDCLYHIQFGAMTNDDLSAILSNTFHKKLITSDEWVDVFRAKMAKNEFASGLFKCVQRSLPIFRWNTDKILECRITKRGDKKINVQCRESTWFSATVPVILGGSIELCDCTSSSDFSCYNNETTIAIKVLEYEEQSFEPGTPFKVLFKNTMTMELDRYSANRSSSVLVNCQKHIIILPKKMYEIRLEKFARNLYSHHLEWKAEVKLEDDKLTTIKFHHNPSDEQRGGLISRLQFNRI